MKVTLQGELVAWFLWLFSEYFEVVVNALREKTGGEECVTEVKSAHEQIVTLMHTNPSVIEDAFKYATDI